MNKVFSIRQKFFQSTHTEAHYSSGVWHKNQSNRTYGVCNQNDKIKTNDNKVMKAIFYLQNLL